VQAAWRAEAAQMNASKLALTGAIVQLHELFAFVIATQELLEDAPRLSNRLTLQAARAIRWKASDAIKWGDGNGKPLGYMNAACLVTQTKEAAQVANTIVTANVLKMYSRILRTGGRPLWFANSDTLPQLGQLTIGNQPAWLPSNQPLAGSPDGTLLGRPLLFTEHAHTLGTKGDLSVVDLEGYYAINKAGGGLDFAASIHLFFDFNMSAFRWVFRVGGQPFLSAAVAPARGATTKSHFVTLETRA
jgi:HK97 family phage major capsid protein